MKTATIDLRALAAIAHIVSKEETRHYLKGVCVEITTVHVTYVATDGHVLAATRRNQDDGETLSPLEGRFIIPTHICQHFKLAKRDEFVWATLEHNDGPSLTLRYAGQAITFEAIDGIFPDWRRFVPSKFSGETAQFDMDTLTKLSKVSKALGGQTHMGILYNGHGPALVNFSSPDENAFGVIMPRRFTADHRLPDWFKEKSEALPMAAE